MHVLVVDDEERILRGVQTTLERAGFRVEQTPGGLEIASGDMPPEIANHLEIIDLIDAATGSVIAGEAALDEMKQEIANDPGIMEFIELEIDPVTGRVIVHEIEG